MFRARQTGKYNSDHEWHSLFFRQAVSSMAFGRSRTRYIGL